MSLGKETNKTASLEEYNKIGEELKLAKEELDKQKQIVKEAKAKKIPKDQLDPLVKKLKQMQEQVNKLTEKWRKSDPNKLHIDKEEFDNLMTRRFFVIPSFEIYGGVAGLYDYGPSSCAIKANLLNLWRKHFVIEENMLELDTTCLTPDIVFQASGHVAKFSDFMVKDLKTQECYRADKLLVEFIEKKLSDPNVKIEEVEKLKKVLLEVDSYKQEELGAKMKKLGVKSPEGNDLSDPYPFNLMFSTQIGPTGKKVGYLRPETAQGLFVNFRRLLDYNGGQMPFAAACIGQAFRNEIAPRSGLLRVREFTLAEIEHFLNPNDKSHPKFSTVKDLKIVLYPRENQMNNTGTVTMTIGEALEKGILNNETHAYFVGRTYLFMMEAGILPNGIRFRQHLSNEMAHYATDCWDCELLTSYGWIECVGIADRSCYDLQCHANVSKAELIAWESFKTPKIVEVVAMDVNARLFGKEFRQDSKKIQSYLQTLSDEDKLNFQKELDEKGQKEITVEGKQFIIKKEFVKFSKKQEKITGRNYVPAVIEPSFGIGRIIYAILEHAFWQRKEDKPKDKKTQLSRTVLSLSPTIAPYKAVILPLQNDPRFDAFIPKLSKFLSSAGISHRIDDVGQTIGKRYARADDIGIPFAITIDFKSIEDNTVTLRERDSCTQIRAPVEEVVAIISKLIEKEITWEEVRKKYPEQKETASMTVGKTE